MGGNFSHDDLIRLYSFGTSFVSVKRARGVESKKKIIKFEIKLVIVKTIHFHRICRNNIVYVILHLSGYRYTYKDITGYTIDRFYTRDRSLSLVLSRRKNDGQNAGSITPLVEVDQRSNKG